MIIFFISEPFYIYQSSDEKQVLFVLELEKNVFSIVPSYRGVMHPTGNMQDGFCRHKHIIGEGPKKCNTARPTPFSLLLLSVVYCFEEPDFLPITGRNVENPWTFH